MDTKKHVNWAVSLIVLLIGPLLCLGADESPATEEADTEVPPIYPTAILHFQERGSEVKGYGAKVSDLMFASLAANPELLLVDRADLEKQLEELELNLSGIVEPKQAIQVGQLTGARILITGSVFQVNGTVYVVAKIIGTETSRVLGASVKGRISDDLGTLVERLSEQVSQRISKDARQIVAKAKKMEDRIATLKEALGDAPRPTILVRIEEHHVGKVEFDPAAQTEFILICKETGFDVIDPEAGSTREADIVIEGVGLSEFALRRGELVGVKARLEVKAIAPETGKVIAVDRQTTVVVDLTEWIAGKTALQKAAAEIAERLLPKLIQKEGGDTE